MSHAQLIGDIPEMPAICLALNRLNHWSCGMDSFFNSGLSFSSGVYFV
jgi:hypothetical protein